jgi:hypothetical protein
VLAAMGGRSDSLQVDRVVWAKEYDAISRLCVYRRCQQAEKQRDASDDRQE